MTAAPQLPDRPQRAAAAAPATAAGTGTGTGPAVRQPWPLRVRDALSAYLPLLMMALLALASWWLVKNSPRALAEVDARPLSSDPDYTMTHFALERFDAGGRLKLRIEGDVMRHYPATERTEIDSARIRAVAADGRVTLARARRALANGDGSEVQLLGGAEVASADAAGTPLVMRSEFLHAFLVSERVHTPLPVTVVQGNGGELRAAGLDYDHATQRLDLKGPMRAELPARGPQLRLAAKPSRPPDAAPLPPLAQGERGRRP